MLELNGFYNMDCMDGMKEFSDKYFELAIVDPPYGIGKDWKKRNNNRDRYIDTTYTNNSIPDEEYFNELKRIAKNQIIWGWNYYTEYLGPTNYLIFWDKVTNGSFYSEGEIAYTSFRQPLKIFRYPWDGYRMGKETGTKKIHPHQKPIELYKWLLVNYAKKGDRILDTHAGSASSLIACHELGFDYVGFELDKDYFGKAIYRLETIKAQMDIFDFVERQ